MSKYKVGDIIQVIEQPFMASLSNLYGKDLTIIEVKPFNFASGITYYYTIKTDDNEIEEIKEDIIKDKMEIGGEVKTGDIITWEGKKYKVGPEDKQINNFYLLNLDGTYAENPNGSSLMVHKSRLKKMEHGGGIAKENNEMLRNQAKEAKHHTEELSNILTNKTNVEPWVIAKMERATTDLSDITHYLDGKKADYNAPIYAFGGMINDLSNNAIDRMNGLVPIATLKELINNSIYIVNDMEQEGFEKDEILSYLSYKMVESNVPYSYNKMATGGRVGTLNGANYTLSETEKKNLTKYLIELGIPKNLIKIPTSLPASSYYGFLFRVTLSNGEMFGIGFSSLAVQINGSVGSNGNKPELFIEISGKTKGEKKQVIKDSYYIELLSDFSSAKKMAKGGGVESLKVGSKIGFLRENGRYEWAEVLSINGDNVNLVVRHPKRRQWDNYFTETKDRIMKFSNQLSEDWKDNRPVFKIKYELGGEVGDLTKLNKLEDYVYENMRKIKENQKDYGFDDVDEITNPYDFANLLGVDSRIFKDADIPFYAEYVDGLLESDEEDDDKMATGGKISIYNLRKGDKVKTKKGNIETILRKNSNGNYETIENDYTHNPESLEFISRPSRKMATGGSMYAEGGGIYKSDLEYSLRIILDEKGLNPISLKSVKKSGKTFTIVVSSYITPSDLVTELNSLLKTSFEIIDGSMTKSVTGNKIFKIKESKMSDGGSMYADGGSIEDEIDNIDNRIYNLEQLKEVANEDEQSYYETQIKQLQEEKSDLLNKKNKPIKRGWLFKKGGQTPAQKKKIEKVMHEFKEGQLHSGSKKGPIVKKHEQAVAIALNEAGLSKKMAKGGGVGKKIVVNTYNGEIEYSNKDIQEMIDDIDMYWDADNLPKWIYKTGKAGHPDFPKNKKQVIEVLSEIKNSKNDVYINVSSKEPFYTHIIKMAKGGGVSKYKVAGREVTIDKKGTNDQTKWKVIFMNNGKTVDYVDVLALITPKPKFSLGGGVGYDWNDQRIKELTDKLSRENKNDVVRVVLNYHVDKNKEQTIEKLKELGVKYSRENDNETARNIAEIATILMSKMETGGWSHKK